MKKINLIAALSACSLSFASIGAETVIGGSGCGMLISVTSVNEPPQYLSEMAYINSDSTSTVAQIASGIPGIGFLAGLATTIIGSSVVNAVANQDKSEGENVPEKKWENVNKLKIQMDYGDLFEISYIQNARLKPFKAGERVRLQLVPSKGSNSLGMRLIDLETNEINDAYMKECYTYGKNPNYQQVILKDKRLITGPVPKQVQNYIDSKKVADEQK